jgi:hypothetical protein
MKLTKLLAGQDIKLITTLKKNMKAQAIDAFDQLLLCKRSIIETINDQLKNIGDLEYSRHRSLTHYMSNIIASLVAYSYQDKKPALKSASQTRTAGLRIRHPMTAGPT